MALPRDDVGRSHAFHLARYGLAVAAVGLAFSVRALLQSRLRDYFPYLLFDPVFLLAARFGGFG
ncbi:MAG: hypothetical protein AB7N65_11605, partial [Vicinamibacterales bacterium]